MYECFAFSGKWVSRCFILLFKQVVHILTIKLTFFPIGVVGNYTSPKSMVQRHILIQLWEPLTKPFFKTSSICSSLSTGSPIYTRFINLFRQSSNISSRCPDHISIPYSIIFITTLSVIPHHFFITIFSTYLSVSSITYYVILLILTWGNEI